jgi:GNAT superfamily N-acetyltransferase
MLNQDEEEDISVAITYSFTSFPQTISLAEEPEDYVTEIYLEIRLLNSHGNPADKIGQGQLSLLHFSLAMDKGYPLDYVMDASASILEMAEQLFDISEGIDCWDKIEAYYDYEPPLQYDVCFLERLEILPAYRKKGIGKLVIGNIIEKFYASCGLVVAKAYPLQYESDNFLGNPEWQASMEYPQMEADFEKARYQLFDYYQKLGFVNPFVEDYFMIRPQDFMDNPLSTGFENEE